MQSFVEIDPPVPEKTIFEGFLPYMDMAAILVMWSGLFMYTTGSPLPIDASYKVWLWLAKRSQSEDLWILWWYSCILPKEGVRSAPVVHFFFRIIPLQSICPFSSSFSIHMIIWQFSPFKCMDHLYWPCRKIGQGHHRGFLLVIDMVAILVMWPGTFI